MQDTREQAPLRFKLDDIMTGVSVEKLDAGDYAARFVDGTRPPIIFERKGLGDLFSTLTLGHQRFKQEIARAADMKIKLILAIEGTSDEIEMGTPYSSFKGASMLRKLQTLWLRYDLPHLFFSSRGSMARYIVSFYKAFGYNFKRDRRSDGKEGEIL